MKCKDCTEMVCGSSWFALSDFTELDKLLKDAGAPEVYLHPSVWECNGHEHYRNDELLIVIPKKKEENES